MERAEQTLVQSILDSAERIHQTLGPGFIEDIYCRAFLCELGEQGLRVEREKLIRIRYGSTIVGKHRLDLVVAGQFIVELKAVSSIIPVHLAQMRSYLQAAGYPLGLIINFGALLLQWELVPWIDKREADR